MFSSFGGPPVSNSLNSPLRSSTFDLHLGPRNPPAPMVCSFGYPPDPICLGIGSSTSGLRIARNSPTSKFSDVADWLRRSCLQSWCSSSQSSYGSKSPQNPDPQWMSGRNPIPSKIIISRNSLSKCIVPALRFYGSELHQKTPQRYCLNACASREVDRFFTCRFLHQKKKWRHSLPRFGFVAENSWRLKKLLCQGDGVTNAGETSSARGETVGGRRQFARSPADEVEDHSKSSDCLYLRRSVSDGELVEHPGSVIILGDVKHRGHVLADGDIVVLGRLQGHVHAGRSGNTRAKVFATEMEPREIRICDSALFCPEFDGTHVPKIAVFTINGGINIQPAVKEVDGKQIETAGEELVQKQIVNIVEDVVERDTMTPDYIPLGTARKMPYSAEKKVQGHQSKSLRSQRPAQVAFVTGLYITIAGIALLGYPKFLFGIFFDLQGVSVGWVRVAAILAVVFGVYYIGTAIGDIRGMKGADAFYMSTVVGRMFLFLSFLWLVLTGAVPRPVFLVGTVNLVGATVMLRALLSGRSKLP